MFDAADAGFERKILLEHIGVLGAHREQDVDRLIRHIVAEIPCRNRRGKPPQAEIFGFPIVDEGLVNLSQQIALGGEHAI